MNSKVKLNAAEVIKHMTEKELKKYKITLEQEGNSSSSSAPAWFKEWTEWFKQFYLEFKSFEKDMLEFKDYVIKRFDNLVKKNKLIE